MIVFEDDHIQVLHNTGESGFLFVTFGNLQQTADGSNYFAKPIVTKARINTLGIMPKKLSWYPAHSMEAAFAALAPILAAHPERVTYGSSMGGYGAIRHSKLLGATATIALCPQWSIDPAETGTVDRRYTQYSGQGGGDAILPEHVAGRVIIIADRSYPMDGFNADRIAGVYPPTEIVATPGVQHHVASLLAKTQRVLDIIAAARCSTPQEFRRLIAGYRRIHPRRIGNVILTATERRPDLAVRIAEAYGEALQTSPGIWRNVASALAVRLRQNGQDERAAVWAAAAESA